MHPSRLTAVSQHGHAGQFTLHGAEHIARRFSGQFVTVYRRYGPGEIGPLLCAVTHDDHFRKRFVVLCHQNLSRDS